MSAWARQFWSAHRKQPGIAAGGRGRNRRSHLAPADGVDARRRDCEDAPAIVPLHGVGRGAEAKLPGDGSAPCLPVPIPAGLPHHPQIFRGQTLPGPSIRGLPRWVHRNLPPLSRRCARTALRDGAGPSYGLPGQSGAPTPGSAIRRHIGKKRRILGGIDR